MYIGRLRPNFYAMCGFGKSLLKCTADMAHQYEARQSFPSGHSGLSFCSMGVLAWFALGCWIRKCNRTASNKNILSFGTAMKQKNAKIAALISLSPLIFSTFVATSRIVDNWHHPSDVIAGTIIGFVCATISYHLW